MNNVKIDKNREVAVVVYKDEDVLGCLKQEMLEWCVKYMREGKLVLHNNLGNMVSLEHPQDSDIRFYLGEALSIMRVSTELDTAPQDIAILREYENSDIRKQIAKLEQEKARLEALLK